MLVFLAAWQVKNFVGFEEIIPIPNYWLILFINSDQNKLSNNEEVTIFCLEIVVISSLTLDRRTSFQVRV